MVMGADPLRSIRRVRGRSTVGVPPCSGRIPITLSRSMPTTSSVRWIAGLAVAALGTIPLVPQARTAACTAAHAADVCSHSVARAKPGVVTVSTIATSPGGRPVHLVRIGADDDAALLVLAARTGRRSPRARSRCD